MPQNRPNYTQDFNSLLLSTLSQQNVKKKLGGNTTKHLEPPAWICSLEITGIPRSYPTMETPRNGYANIKRPSHSTGPLALTLAGLTPAEDASPHWTHEEINTYLSVSLDHLASNKGVY
jgi:hypothetical protein